VLWKSARVLVLALAFAPLACSAAEEEAPVEPAPLDKAAQRAADKAEALAVLKEVSDFLGQQKSLRFRARTGHDSIQENGVLLEFGGERDYVLRRPDRLRLDATSRYGKSRTLFFDGRQVSINLPSEQAFVQVKKTGTIDEVLDYLDTLHEPTPLSDFLESDFYSGVVDQIEHAAVIGSATLGGVECDHLAFIGDVVDAQLWIEQGDRPLPVRYVLLFKKAAGQPQFWADFTEWELNPDAPDSLFAFTPPEGAEQLDMTVSLRSAGDAAQQESK
jgi:hypothetical protein